MKRFLAATMMLLTAHAMSATYYVDSIAGGDKNDGLSQDTAWKTLKKASQVKYVGGDKLLLKKESRFSSDDLSLNANGTEKEPVIVDAYGTGELPVIDAQDAQAALIIDHCNFVEVSNIEITSDGKKVSAGVAITTPEKTESKHIYLRNLYIHDIFHDATAPKDKKANKIGNGIHIAPVGMMSDLLVEDCRLERTAALGILVTGVRGTTNYIENVRVLNNKLTDIGGPGMQPSVVDGLLVKGNVVDKSGASSDPRMRGRGSGIWPWGSNNVVIENNEFMHARGVGDSCGAHIDMNCRNVLVQRNLSLDNEGGFIEILGNNYNCSYRYNVSINDGARKKGVNGAIQDGKILWLSSFTHAERVGPFNSYIYNNTIYVKDSMRAAFNITRAASGALITNNIFYIPGKTESVGDDQDKKTLGPTAVVKNVLFENNLYARADTLPKELPQQDGEPLHDSNPIVADPKFKNPGGFDPADYIPANAEAIKDKGVKLRKLPGDEVGLTQGLDVTEDFFGNPIQGLPDLGAIELQDK